VLTFYFEERADLGEEVGSRAGIHALNLSMLMHRKTTN
jgi:hypothetical protein